MRALLGTLFLLAVSSAIGLVLTEGMVRVLRPQLTYRFPRGMFTPDPVTSYALTPGFVGIIDTPEFRTDIRVNQQGFRHAHDIGPKPTDALRVLMIGDSFPMGVGVDEADTLAAQLERVLKPPSAARRVEVVNAGVPGYATVQELAQLEARGLALRPDLVLLVFFIGNDVAESTLQPQAIRDGYLVSGAAVSDGWRTAVLTWLSIHSQLYRFLGPWLDRLHGRADAEGEVLRKAFLDVYDRHVTGLAWAATGAAIERFAAITQRAGVDRAMVVVPDQMQVSPPLWQTVLVETGLDDQRVGPMVPNERLRAIAAHAGVPLLDLTAALAAGGDGGSLYFPQDHHLTVAGTAQAMGALGPFVQGLVDARMPPR